jgi:hypothetical protein
LLQKNGTKKNVEEKEMFTEEGRRGNNGRKRGEERENARMKNPK